jgi:phosphatidate phosphatase APP1
VQLPGYAQSSDEAEGAREDDWRQSFSSLAARQIENVDEHADVSWRRFVKRLKLDNARHIAAYHGYGNGERIWVQGRLLADRPYAGPREDDNWWDNLQATYGRWESDEIPHAAITLTYDEQRLEVQTDGEGYYQASFPISPDRPVSNTVVAQHEAGGRLLTATHWIMLLEPAADYLVISDMDDTVIHTGITRLLQSARLTFLANARTRKPLPGVAELYEALHRGSDGERRNPVIYVSNSAWNLFDLLRDFVNLNGIPEGPLLLRDVELSDLWSKSTEHKTETVQNLVDRYADLPVVLIGDSGQHDAEIYAGIVASNPGRVGAVYLRDVDPKEESEYDRAVDSVIEESRVYGVPFLRVADSAQIAEHAAAIGLISGSAIDRIQDDADRDQEREPFAAALSSSGGS